MGVNLFSEKCSFPGIHSSLISLKKLAFNKFNFSLLSLSQIVCCFCYKVDPQWDLYSRDCTYNLTMFTIETVHFRIFRTKTWILSVLLEHKPKTSWIFERLDKIVDTVKWRFQKNMCKIFLNFLIRDMLCSTWTDSLII